ncbi:hypothetical protein Leryth_025313 [Lithospermum erythrorhizon]|nr:hypothetical protein Leryth_025313 [Lithospermum erythrorhizon]
MALTQSLLSLSSNPFLPTKPLLKSPKLPLNPSSNTPKPPTKPTLLTTLCTSPKPYTPPPSTEEDILEAVAQADGEERSLPGVRVYENDAARLSVVGAVDYQQAVTAASADGGEAANQHIQAGLDAMVVETLFPGSSDQHSTIATRLFLPARKVKEKARRLKNSLTQDMFKNNASKNILALTFRQVSLQQLWNFELLLFKAGSGRNMDDLENPREVPVSFAVDASDERVISAIAEVLCLASLESTERSFLENSFGRSSNYFFKWNQKPKKIVSKDSSVVLYNLLEDKVVSNANSLLKDFSLKRPTMNLKVKVNSNCLMPSVRNKLEKLGGYEFVSWLSEYVPCFKLQLDADKFDNVKFEGWKEFSPNKFEVWLTHSQMVDLTSILDMYYDDLFTVHSRPLSCHAVARTSRLPLSKNGSSLLKPLIISITSGLLLVIIGVLGQIYLPRLPIGRRLPQERHALQSSDISYTPNQSFEPVEAYCVTIINKIKDSFGWHGDTSVGAGCCVWTGDIPRYLTESGVIPSSIVANASASSSDGKSDEEIKKSAEDIASYQVVLTTGGKIVGFQPTSRVAVNQWASNPLNKELYSGKTLSPGLMESGLKINRPNEVAALELLVSVNQQSRFALVRPLSVDTLA